jgi:hypothetical protein
MNVLCLAEGMNVCPSFIKKEMQTWSEVAKKSGMALDQ